MNRNIEGIANYLCYYQRTLGRLILNLCFSDYFKSRNTDLTLLISDYQSPIAKVCSCWKLVKALLLFINRVNDQMSICFDVGRPPPQEDSGGEGSLLSMALNSRGFYLACQLMQLGKD